MKKGFFKKCIKTLTVAVLAAVFAMSAIPSQYLSASPVASRTPQNQPSRQAREIMDTITSRRPPVRPGFRIDANARIPHASGNDPFSRSLNNRFTAQFNSFVQAHRASAISSNFETEIFHAGAYPDEFVSVVVTMEAVSASVTTIVATTVICVASREIISLEEYSPNILSLVNNRIQDIISESPRDFVANFPGVDGDHPFYLDGNRLVIPFASGEFRLGRRGAYSIRLNTDNISHAVIEDDSVIILSPDRYNTTMVRLTTIRDHFGYATPWRSAAHPIEISLGERVVTSITINKNLYICHNGTEHTLEEPPRIFNGRTYVPLSFFEKILGIPTTVTADGQIIMSKYVPPARPEPSPVSALSLRGYTP